MTRMERGALLTMTRVILVPAILLLASQAACQVRVSVLSSQTQHLEGEPISVIVRVTNVGSDPVGYDYCDGHADLEIIGQQRMPSKNIWGCFGGGLGSGAGCGIDHPPILLPGKSTDFTYLLRDYRLKPGEYSLQASGKAGVRWHFMGDYRRNGLSRMPTSKFQIGDPVPGEFFDQNLRLNIRQGGPHELEAAFIPYVRDAASPDPEVSYRARDAISEMAPAFLEKTIFGFAARPNSLRLAVKGLSRIDTAESRVDLVDLFHRNIESNIREYVVRALAGMKSADQIAFFTSLLQGPDSEAEGKIRQWAVLAIGLRGGGDGVDFLDSFLNRSAKPGPWLRSVVATALSNSESRQAIPVLIEMYSDPDSLVRNNVCGSLMSLTHQTWCDGSGQTDRLQSTWRKWWREYGSSAKIYGPEECIDPAKASPLIFTQSAGSRIP